MCETEPQGGAWEVVPTEGGVENWEEAGDLSPKPGAYANIEPHHPYLTAVHASHLPTGELILFHGQSEERVWTIGSDAATMRWHPVPYTVSQENPDYCSVPADADTCYADIFCAGHVLLPDGRLVSAGGNVTGADTGGGLRNIYSYDPKNAGPDVYPFGWTEHTPMTYDRWYPTLTVLPDETVLISSGASTLGGRNIFEIFDATANSTTPLTIQGTSPFGGNQQIPLYPFMFVLPNGDIFYAGGEGAADNVSQGRVLIPGYNNGGVWAWDDREFESEINGGSAVMYEPGKILKSGGLHRNDPGFSDDDNVAIPNTEIIDLSTYASGDYADAPDFNTVVVGDMTRARHFHTLTLLPDGRILATGGNARGTGETGDHPANKCEFAGQSIADQTCSSDCPAVPSRCRGSVCPYLNDKACAVDTDCGVPCPCPPGSICMNGLCQMECPVGTCQEDCAVGVCGAAPHCSPGGGFCDPGNNACLATRSAEIWNPTCWTELDQQLRPRMYHSTALLLPDGRVISMGGGHRQGLFEQASAEYFRPEYGQQGLVNIPEIVVVGETDMIFESSFDAGDQHLSFRERTHSDVTLTASGPTLSANNLIITAKVPCNTSTASVTVKLAAHTKPGKELGRPPTVTNTTAAIGPCGALRSLTATVADPDGDASPPRWRVDGVLLAPGTSSITITQPHTIEAQVRDARGATTTSKKSVTCN